jgi:snurportin-1
MGFIEGHDFENPVAVQNCLQTYPMFEDGAELDGFLFYHKEALYESGTTPLVLWLFPFMIDEVLSMFRVNPEYNSLKPANYTNYVDYIQSFNEKMEKKKTRSTRRSQSMEIETSQELNETPEIDEMQRMIDLEKFGD